jgi:hypothetical protein
LNSSPVNLEPVDASCNFVETIGGELNKGVDIIAEVWRDL